jgi:hypothetical protein
MLRTPAVLLLRHVLILKRMLTEWSMAFNPAIGQHPPACTACSLSAATQMPSIVQTNNLHVHGINVHRKLIHA